MNLKFIAVAALLAATSVAGVATAADPAQQQARPVAAGQVVPAALAVQPARADTPSSPTAQDAGRPGDASTGTDTAVPFNETLALMLAGLGMIGFLASRRNVNR